MLQKPVIILDLLKVGGPPVKWPLQGGGVYARNAEEFRSILNRLTFDGEFLNTILVKQRQFLDLRFANRGKAAAAIVDHLEQQTRVTQPLATDFISGTIK